MQTRLQSPNALHTAIYYPNNKCLELLDRRRSMQVPLRHFSSPTSCLCWSPDSRLLAIGLEDGSVEILDSTTLNWLLIFSPVRQLSSPPPIVAMAFSPDCTQLALGSSDGKISVVSLTRNAVELLWTTPVSSEAVTILVFSEEGSRLASASVGGFLVVLDAIRGVELAVWRCPLFVSELNWIDDEVFISHLGNLVMFKPIGPKKAIDPSGEGAL